MHTDDDFLRKLLDNPADDTTRLVYADWLDEQGDDRSKMRTEFVRKTVSVAEIGKKHRKKRKALHQRLQELAAALDTDWLAVVSRTRVENCAKKRNEEGLTRYPARFEFVCDRQWDELRPTDDRRARFCDSCTQIVHYCDTIMEARQHAGEGHCIAIDLGVIRRPRDWAPPLLMLGRPAPGFMERERDRLRPDTVSEQRDRQKRGAEERNPPNG